MTSKNSENVAASVGLTAPPLAAGSKPEVYRRTRWLALLALGALFCSVVYLTSALYDAVRDTFVTPIVLSPDSDSVISSKLSLAHMLADKSALEIRVREISATLAASEEALDKLRGLRSVVSQSLAWSSFLNTEALSASSVDLKALAAQSRLLQEHIATQRAYVEEMGKNYGAGLVHKTELLREQSELNQLRIAALENERSRVASRLRLTQSGAAKRALSAAQNAAIATPEMIEQRGQLVRLELELLKLDADWRARSDELRGAREQLERTEQLIAQVKLRPAFRAIEAEQLLALVPYSQLDGVQAGVSVYACALWGLFACDEVGEVLEVVPGEVSQADPWGTLVRGLYVVLQLEHTKAAHAKLLRVRPHAGRSSARGRGTAVEISAARK